MSIGEMKEGLPGEEAMFEPLKLAAIGLSRFRIAACRLALSNTYSSAAGVPSAVYE